MFWVLIRSTRIYHKYTQSIENILISIWIGFSCKIFTWKAHFLFTFGYFICSIELEKYPISKNRMRYLERPNPGSLWLEPIIYCRILCLWLNLLLDISPVLLKLIIPIQLCISIIDLEAAGRYFFIILFIKLTCCVSIFIAICLLNLTQSPSCIYENVLVEIKNNRRFNFSNIK